MYLQGCHGNGYDVTTSLQVLPDKRFVKLFIDYLHAKKYFLLIFPRFKRFITFKTLSSHLVFEKATDIFVTYTLLTLCRKHYKNQGKEQAIQMDISVRIKG